MFDTPMIEITYGKAEGKPERKVLLGTMCSY